METVSVSATLDAFNLAFGCVDDDLPGRGSGRRISNNVVHGLPTDAAAIRTIVGLLVRREERDCVG